MKRRDNDGTTAGKRSRKHKYHRGTKQSQLRAQKNAEKAYHQEENEEVDVEEEQTTIAKSTTEIKSKKPRAEQEPQVSKSTSNEEDVIDVDVAGGSLDEAEMMTMVSTSPQIGAGQSKVSSKNNSTKKTTNKRDSSAVVVTKPANVNSITANNAKKTKKRRDSGTSSEEERWLTAIESGKLEDVEDVELKKMKDPKLMTARQRAIYDRNNDAETTIGCAEVLLSLPTGYREKEKPQTAEEIQKAALKSLKRKQLADEKREKDKKKTMERLLKKQESKQRTAIRNKNLKETQPMIRYCNNVDGISIQMPTDYEFPLKAQTAREPPPLQLCGIAGCGKPKVYCCSKTNLPLCSFACYRKNVQAVRQIMC